MAVRSQKARLQLYRFYPAEKNSAGAQADGTAKELMLKLLSAVVQHRQEVVEHNMTHHVSLEVQATNWSREFICKLCLSKVEKLEF